MSTNRILTDKTLTRRHWVLAAGDFAALLGMTLIGFASHETLGAVLTSSAFVRLLATLLPLAGAWLLLAWLLGAYDLSKAGRAQQLWRPAAAYLLAAPLGVWLRSLWLGRPVVWIFLLVMAGTGCLAILVWRSLYILMERRSSHG